ncbi:MAG: DNA internalization-related competence protein ComEC/Rec2 [Halopseudomonas sp.]
MHAVKPLRGWLPVVFGLTWGLASGSWLLAHQLPDSWQGDDLLAVGTVVGLPERQQGRCRFDLALDQLVNHHNDKTPQLLPRTIRLSWYRCEQLPQPAQRWQFKVRLKRPHGFVNPGGFDYPLYLLSRGIDASGYIRDSALADKPKQLEDALITGWVDRWRLTTVEMLGQAQIPTRSQALLAALLVGDKRGLDEDTWTTLRDTGTAHLFVISGLHIGMLAGVCFGLMFGLGRLWPAWNYRRRISAAAISAIIGAGGYALLAGFSLPSQRAWVMICAVMLSLIGFRAMTPSQRLWLAATAVLLIEPLAVRQPGFWLSFGACSVLVYAFAGHLGRVHYTRQLIWAQLAIAIGLTPWLLFQFQQWPAQAPLINLLAIPLATLLLPLALVGLLLMSISPAVSQPILLWLAQLLEWGWQALEWSQQQWSPLTASGPVPIWVVILALFGAMLMLMPRSIPGRWLGLLLWLPLLLPLPSVPEKGGYRVTVLDVGQGLAVLIETHQHRMLYDSGPRYRSGFNAAEAAIIPYLSRRGIRQLDQLLISHADIDHAGGQAVLESRLVIDQTSTGSDKITADHLCRAGQAWQWDGVNFEILHPDDAAINSENNRSCVLKIDNGRHALLLTGDIEAEIEHLLIKHLGGKLQANTLLAAHHGSRSSSSDVFLQRVAPERVLISSGWRNRFGHPHPEVVQRIEARQLALFNTATQGAVELNILTGGQAEVALGVDSLWGYWH